MSSDIRQELVDIIVILKYVEIKYASDANMYDQAMLQCSHKKIKRRIELGTLKGTNQPVLCIILILSAG